MSDDVVVVGAGAAGLAVAAGLGRAGVRHTVLERSPGVGAAWRGRYDSLRLHTVRWLSGLPGAPIPRRYGSWVARDDLVAYLEDYARRFDIHPELGVEATRVERTPTGWRVETTDRPREASTVVVATGYCRTPHVPEWPGRDGFPGPLVHSADYRRAEPYAGRRVLVVGAGNSAAEIAVDLADAGARVDLAVRTPPNIVRRDTLGIPSQLIGITLRRAPEQVMNPLSALLRRVSVPDLTAHGLPAPPGDGFTQFLRTQTVPILDHGFVRAVRAGRIVVRAPVAGFDGAEVRLADGVVLRPDAVIAATGYRPDLERMVGHLGVLDEAGVPLAHGAVHAPQAPGLHFVGISVQLAGQLHEIGLEARAVGRSLAGRRATTGA